MLPTNQNASIDYEINALLASVLDGARRVLNDRLVGMYLHGSLALGDFTPGRSDIDFVVVTDSELEPALVTALTRMHERITALGGRWAKHMEGSYIPRAALRRFDPIQSNFPALREDGSFDIDYHGSDWIIQRYVLREHGISLAGPPASTLIDPIYPEDLRISAAGILREWWAPMLEDLSLQREPLLREPGYQAYAVLTMCRTLYTLHHGAVAAKSTAARWAQAGPAKRFSALIDAALAWRAPEFANGDPSPTMNRLDEVLEFIRFTLE